MSVRRSTTGRMIIRLSGSRRTYKGFANISCGQRRTQFTSVLNGDYQILGTRHTVQRKGEGNVISGSYGRHGHVELV